MKIKVRRILSFFLAADLSHGLAAQTASVNHEQGPKSPVSITVMDRVRTDATQWYADPPYTTTYPYVEQLFRFGVGQRIHRFDWMLEGSQNAVFDVSDTSVSPITTQGQLGLGGTYYVANSNNTLPVAASVRQAFLRYHGNGPDTTLRLGRFEYFDGQETQPANPALSWLQTNRIAQRLIGNFGFSNGQRSFDGVDAHCGRKSWDLTTMAGRPTQGVFNMNANPELNVDIQYLAYSRSEAHQRALWRMFALGYHDGRTGVVKTDNRALAVRQADHKNIRIGTYGADFMATVPAGPDSIDVLLWGALQNGRWGLLDHRAGAAAAEAGLRFDHVATTPWIRGGFFRSTGDNSPTDNTHNSFFQVLPTPRGYARFPFYNDENRREEFVQIIDKPTRKVDIRSDVHFLQLTSANDLWYQGGGAFDGKVFGYVGRPSGGHSSFATLCDISSDMQLTQWLALNLYYAHSFRRSVIRADYPAGSGANYGYLELVYRWNVKQKGVPTK
jgi:hypothetical protein